MSAADPRPVRVSFRAVLAHADFRRLWWGQIISSIGDRFYQFALLYVVLKLSPAESGGMGRESARVLFCGMLPGVLFAPWIGRFVDRHSRRAAMILSDIGRALTALAMLGLWLAFGSPPVIFLLIAIMGFLNAVFIPARQASVPALVPAHHLVTANALVTVVGVVASLVGAAAGLVVSVFGERSSFLATAAGFLFSGWMISRIRDPLRSAGASAAVQSWRQLGRVFREAWTDRVVRLLFALAGGAQFIIGLFLVFVLEYAVRTLDLSPLAAGAEAFASAAASLGFKRPIIEIRLVALVFLLAASAAGLVLGVVLSGKSRRLAHLEGLPIFALAALGLCFVALAGVHSFGAAWVLSAAIGFAGALLNIPLDARLQARVHDDNRGRVFAARSAWTYLCFLAALALNLDGGLLAWKGAPALIATLGWLCAAAAVLLGAAWRKSLMRTWNPATGG